MVRRNINRLMEIKILGTGCPKCKRLEEVAREVATEMGLQATFTKVTDVQDIMAYDIVATPGLVVNEKVLVAGRLPSKDEVRKLLEQAI